MTNLVDQFDPTLRKIITKKPQVAVIPVGSIEQHGAHLPISTDTDIVTEIAKQICDKEKFLQLPTITYGISYEHAPFFHLSVRNNTLLTILADLIESLVQNKIKTVFVINGHHGNQKALSNLSKKIEKKIGKSVRVYVFSYWNFMKERFDHAGFVETSLMLAVSQKRTCMKRAVKGLDETKLSKKEIKSISKLASKSFPRATKNGIWGDPTKATKKQGQRILKEITENLRKKCQTCLTESRLNTHK
jgi:creatinine amidohydrolase